MDDSSHQIKPVGVRIRLTDLSANLCAFRWSLWDMLLLITFAGVAIRLWLNGLPEIACGLLATAVCMRAALVDFSFVGAIATLLTILFGLPTLVLILLNIML